MANRKNTRKIPQGGNIFVDGLLSGGIGAGVLLLLVLVLPLLLIGLDDPNSLTLPAVCFSAFAGGAVCGVLSASRCRDNPLLCALLGATVMLLPILVGSLAVGGESDIISGIAVAAITIASSVGGAFIIQRMGSNKKRNMKKALKHR